MHVCYITHEYPKKGMSQGGIGSFVQTIGRALVKTGIKVSVVGVGNFENEFENDKGVNVYRLKRSSWRVGRFFQNKNILLKKIEDIHNKESIDVVEGSELNFAFFPKKYFAKKVIRLHGGHRFFAGAMGKKPAFWRSYQESMSFENADALIAVSEYVGIKTKELVKFKKDFTKIYNLVDTNKFYEADMSKVVPKKIIFVGTITEKKGIKQLVEAMVNIIKKDPNVTLEIIGRDWLDPTTKKSYTEYLKTFITNETKGNIHFTGALLHDEIPKKLESAQVCVYPSHLEAQGIVVVEAMAMGKPTIFSEKGPGPEMIQENINGLLCNPFSPEDIASKIMYMLDNLEKANVMGKNARRDILRKFNPESIINQNIEFYRSLK